MRVLGKFTRYDWHAVVVPSLDAITFLAWGILLLQYWITGKIELLIHPNLVGFVVVTGIILLTVGLSKAWQLYQQQKKRSRRKGESVVQHITLFPPGWSTIFLLATVLLAFLIPPTVLSSETALQRGVRENLPLTQTQPEPFRVNLDPEQRSLIDWIKTINAYPEPNAYNGDPVQVKGFVLKMKQLSDDYFLLAKFIITCCAIDAYPIAIPVETQQQKDYPADTWLEIEGEMKTETLPIQGTEYQPDHPKRQVVIEAQQITEIPTPSNPYGY